MFGVEFEWINADSFIGKDTAFLRLLDQMDETFMADVAKKQTIYLEDPTPIVPEPKSKRGQKPSKIKAQYDPIRVDNGLNSNPLQTEKRHAFDTPQKESSRSKFSINGFGNGTVKNPKPIAGI
jgi:SRSO17 transposase